MKKLCLILFILGACQAIAFAQSGVELKTKSGAESITDRKKRMSRLDREIVVKVAIDSTFVFAVDGKIYRGKDIDFEQIPRSTLELVSAVHDLNSDTGIKHIFIYRKKEK